MRQPRSHLRRTALALAALAALAACSDPKDLAGWAARAASRNRLDEKLAALASARAAAGDPATIGDRAAAVAPLAEVLGQAPKARQQAAVILGELGRPEAAAPLMAALDRSGTADPDVNLANAAIAAALGALRAQEAVPVLAPLAARASDPFVQVAAIDALGAIGAPAAVDSLLAVVEDGQAAPFAVKKALLALGRIGDPRAVPAVVRALFVEGPGVSYFPEAAFAVSQLGEAAAAPLTALVEGRDSPLAAWAAERRVHPAALRAKAAQLLGDVGGQAAVPALVAALSYQDETPEARLFVRVFAAESLGRLRARQAVGPLASALAAEKDPDARHRYADALARIGDPAGLPALRAAAVAPGPVAAREAMLEALSRVGGEIDRPLLEAARAACAVGCQPALLAALDGMAARLDAARACGDGLACWSGKLSDERAEVRDRAALVVGRDGGAAEVAPLRAALVRPVGTDAELAARYHAVLALDEVTRRHPPGSAGLEAAAAIEAAVAADKGRLLTAGVNEDALRLAGRLRRAAR